MRKKKKLGLSEAANQMAEIFEKHLEKLSPAERKRRTLKAHTRLVARLAKKRASKSSESLSKSSEVDYVPPVRFVARSH